MNNDYADRKRAVRILETVWGRQVITVATGY